MSAGHLIAGATGEDAAVIFLERRGYAILDRNWRHKSYELDVVCLAPLAGGRSFLKNWFSSPSEDARALVFVEVKTRSLSAFGGLEGALGAFGKAKQQRLARAVAYYLSEHDAWSRTCRLDLICVSLEEPDYKVEHYEDVLDFGNAMGGGDTAWQPW